jgi:hypothetical protein
VDIVRAATHAAKSDHPDRDRVAEQAEAAIMTLAPKLKSETFQEELEWRLISQIFTLNDGQFRFRSGRTTLIPYLDFVMAERDEPLTIGEIIIGPNREPDLTRRAVLDAFESTNVICHRVRNSAIPYREL